MIKIVVCDGDGTLQLPNPTEEIFHLLKKMSDLGIGLAVASNSKQAEVEARFAASGLSSPLIIATPNEVGARKPSPKFIEYISDQTGVKPNEMIYLGDDDKTDIFCAINSHVLPFASMYSSTGKPDYGIPVDNPTEFALYLEAYCMQNQPFFGWQCVVPSSSLEIYALIGQHGDMGLTKPLKSLLKDKQPVSVGSKKNSFGRILFHYFLSQSYLSGLIQNVDYVSVYPGHGKNSQNKILAQYSEILPKILRNKYLSDLLIRHTDANPSHFTRNANRNIYDQLSTVMLNEKYRDKIVGKRVLVLDDFTTSGNSLETARVLLLKASAASMTGIAFAKYTAAHNVVILSGDWDPFTPFNLPPNAISSIHMVGISNVAADKYFMDMIWKPSNR